MLTFKFRNGDVMWGTRWLCQELKGSKTLEKFSRSVLGPEYSKPRNLILSTYLDLINSSKQFTFKKCKKCNKNKTNLQTQIYSFTVVRRTCVMKSAELSSPLLSVMIETQVIWGSPLLSVRASYWISLRLNICAHKMQHHEDCKQYIKYLVQCPVPSAWRLLGWAWRW